MEVERFLIGEAWTLDGHDRVAFQGFSKFLPPHKRVRKGGQAVVIALFESPAEGFARLCPTPPNP